MSHTMASSNGATSETLATPNDTMVSTMAPPEIATSSSTEAKSDSVLDDSAKQDEENWKKTKREALATHSDGSSDNMSKAKKIRLPKAERKRVKRDAHRLVQQERRRETARRRRRQLQAERRFVLDAMVEEERLVFLQKEKLLKEQTRREREAHMEKSFTAGKPKIVIDCGFGDSMNDKELTSLAKQIQITYGMLKLSHMPSRHISNHPYRQGTSTSSLSSGSLSRRSSNSGRFITRFTDNALWNITIPLSDYECLLAENLLGPGTIAKMDEDRVLAYEQKAPLPVLSRGDEQQVVYTVQKAQMHKMKPTRVITARPIRSMDAPKLMDEFYLNLIDWSSTNIVAVALGSTVHFWNGETAKVNEFCTLEDGHITSVRWSNDGGHLAVGTSHSKAHIWDVNAAQPRLVRTYSTHARDVNAICWNGGLLSTGSKDKQIHHHDVRKKDPLSDRMTHHRGKICSLEWSEDRTSLASGANDQTACVTDLRKLETPRLVLDKHQAAVKALAWCPWQKNILATGAGTNDKCIRFWNTQRGTCLDCIDTGSQVTGLRWSPSNEKEIVSSHGFEDNQLSVWAFPSLKKLADLKAHTDRIVSISSSPDGAIVLSAGADETIRLWRIWEAGKNRKPEQTTFLQKIR